MKIIVYEYNVVLFIFRCACEASSFALNSKRASNYCGFIMITCIYRVEERTRSFWTRVKHNGLMRYYVR